MEASDGKETLELFVCKGEKVDLLLLEITLGIYDGFTVCREIRKTSDVPVIILSSRGTEFDEIYGLEAGADDYIKKPVSQNLLVTRIQVILRRLAKEKEKNYICTGFEINDTLHKVIVLGKEVALSPKEYSILLILVENRGKVVTREELLRRVWGYYYYGGLRTVDTHINRIRIKLGDGGKGIHTIRGFGYRIES
ncbi:MAG: response regulator transcription factor [Clostridiales bacterium]|nr:response regulator transcription factor [Clostridiales bacterium]